MMDLIVSLCHTGLLFFGFHAIWKREVTGLQNLFWPALVLKLVAGICLGLLYKYYYPTGDTFAYFEDGTRLSQLAHTDIPRYLNFLWSGDESFAIWADLHYQQPRALFLSKITSAFCLLTRNNYWTIAVYFSAISFLSAWLLVKKIVALWPSAKTAAIIGFLFFPSVVFWGSGLTKEGLAVACLFFLSYIFLKIWMRETVNIPLWLVSLFSIWVVWNLKYYYLAVFLPVVSTAFIVKMLLLHVRLKSPLLKIILWCFVFFIPLCLISMLHPNFYPSTFFEMVVSNYAAFHVISNPEDVIFYHSLQPTLSSVIKNTPWALVSGLFRPFISEVHNPLQLISAIENLLLLGLFFSALSGVQKKIKDSGEKLLVFSVLAYSVTLCVFLALSSPNFGTLSRYRVGFLPFLVFLLSINNLLVIKIMSSKVGRYLVP